MEYMKAEFVLILLIIKNTIYTDIELYSRKISFPTPPYISRSCQCEDVHKKVWCSAVKYLMNSVNIYVLLVPNILASVWLSSPHGILTLKLCLVLSFQLSAKGEDL